MLLHKYTSFLFKIPAFSDICTKIIGSLSNNTDEYQTSADSSPLTVRRVARSISIWPCDPRMWCKHFIEHYGHRGQCYTHNKIVLSIYLSLMALYVILLKHNLVTNTLLPSGRQKMEIKRFDTLTDVEILQRVYNITFFYLHRCF